MNANCAETEEFTFNFDISSESTFFWSDTNVSFVIVGIENEINIIPEAYSLNQNYPNPFNPTTQIQFSLPQDSDIRLAVFDLLGREVQVLAEGRYTAGTYSVAFDGTNLASGVYLYQLQAGTQRLTGEMILMK
ncbi:T9SS type A sorting domain-containing protein [candidate division KSB1 bacterium]|nr:T9SS type A sorting domain-containing protein [candidate division KSB1 bacterium]